MLSRMKLILIDDEVVRRTEGLLRRPVLRVVDEVEAGFCLRWPVISKIFVMDDGSG